MGKLMVESVVRNVWTNLWQDMLLRGIVAVIFGLLALLWPGITLGVFVLLFGAFAFVDGILLVLQAVTTRRHEDYWWARLLHGLVSIAAGVAVFAWPGITLLVLAYIIAAYAIVTGILEILGAIELRKAIKGELLMLLSGLLLIAIGVLLIWRPGIGLIAMVQTIGIFAIAYGIVIAVLALRMRGYAHKMAKPSV
ncbi:MAG TPA: HdeD family acid-resistance protein [Methanocella sp.]|nr:HdeD family acid-resistance protein [Methanocella sp.]